jgi:hypothetical protein
MSAPEHPAWQKLEPMESAARAASRPPGEYAIELSKAISLKRIADVLAGNDKNSGLIHVALDALSIIDR